MRSSFVPLADLNLLERIVTPVFVIGDFYLLMLWCYAIARTRLLFFWVLALAGFIYLLLALGNVALAYDLPRVRELFG